MRDRQTEQKVQEGSHNMLQRKTNTSPPNEWRNIPFSFETMVTLKKQLSS